MGCIGCGGEIVKGSFLNPPDTFEGAIERAVEKVRSGRASAIRLTAKGKVAKVERVGSQVIVMIKHPDGSVSSDVVRV